MIETYIDKKYKFKCFFISQFNNHKFQIYLFSSCLNFKYPKSQIFIIICNPNYIHFKPNHRKLCAFQVKLGSIECLLSNLQRF